MTAPLVLLTQAEDRNLAHEEALARMGLDTLSWPLLNTEVVADVSLDFAGVDTMLVTSARAIDAFAKISDRRDLPVLCVGDSTAAAARSVGFGSVRSASGAVADLATLASELPDARFLYLRGEDVSADLASMIDENRVREAIIYRVTRSEKPPSEVLNALQQGRFAVITVWSQRNADALASHLRRSTDWRIARTTLLAISAKASKPLANTGFWHVLLPPAPDASSMLRTIATAADPEFMSRQDCAGAAGPIT